VEAAARWLAYTAMLLVIGASVFRFGIMGPLHRSGPLFFPATGHRAATLGMVAALALLPIGVVRFYLQARAFTEPGETVNLELIGILLETGWGRGWLAQMMAAGLAAAGAFFARIAAAGWFSAAAGATAVVLSAPLTGHAPAVEQAGSWGYPLDTLHVLGAGAWLGTLGILVAAAWPTFRTDDDLAGPEAARLVHAFHPIALVGATLTMAAGAVLAFLYLEGSLSGLWTSGWGRALLLKLGLLSGVAGFGAWNWRVMRPTLGTAAAARRFTRSALAELALATALLVVTAVLVARPLPGED
jgi:putative copper export protein